MIVCLYGQTCAPFVEPVARALERLGAERRSTIMPVSIEAAVNEPRRWRDVDRLYVLPFDVPRAASGATPPALIQQLFPRAEVLNAPAAHELCCDKVATAQRLLARGVPVPDTLITHDPGEARHFIHEHEHAILKAPSSCAGADHWVVFADDQGAIAGEARGRRYLIELVGEGAERELAQGVLTYPGPFYLQRLVTRVARHGVLTPAQVLRAYVVDGQVMFWTERYRDRYRRPSDFIINVSLGAKYRFLHEMSEEVRKVAVRAAEVLSVRVGVVDIVRTGREGPFVIEVDTDGHHMMIDRQFVLMPEFRSTFDLDAFIVDRLLAPSTETRTRVLG